mmetsp:Transcript_34752/g.83982  ORF Transcript_34752/g.83982 Transcript_34752/m.83982 type:complete len:102 (+) Transcript_34752:284-589(+)
MAPMAPASDVLDPCFGDRYIILYAFCMSAESFLQMSDETDPGLTAMDRIPKPPYRLFSSMEKRIEANFDSRYVPDDKLGIADPNQKCWSWIPLFRGKFMGG